MCLAPMVAASAGLKIGSIISQSQMETLASENTRRLAIELSLRYLSFRPRTEKEIRQYLGRHVIPPDKVDETILRLRELNLVDDASYARQWVEERQRSRPRGARVLRQELRKKGIDTFIIETALPVDDPDEIEIIARRRARLLDTADRQSFIRRLSSYLLRRGYTYDLVETLVRRLWEERQ